MKKIIVFALCINALVACKKTSVERFKTPQELLSGKWNLTKIGLSTFKANTLIKDSIIASTPTSFSVGQFYYDFLSTKYTFYGFRRVAMVLPVPFPSGTSDTLNYSGDTDSVVSRGVGALPAIILVTNVLTTKDTLPIVTLSDKEFIHYNPVLDTHGDTTTRMLLYFKR